MIPNNSNSANTLKDILRPFFKEYIRYLLLSIVFIFSTISCHQDDSQSNQAVEDKKSGDANNSDIGNDCNDDGIDNDDDDNDVPFPNLWAPYEYSFEPEIRTKNGESFTIFNLRENVVIIAFFTTWCPNCPSVLRHLDTLKEKLVAAGITNVTIIALNIGRESTDDIEQHFKDNFVGCLDVYQSLSRWSKVPGIVAVPTVLLFDTNGRSLGQYRGSINYSSNSFFEFVKRKAQKGKKKL